MAAIYKSQLAQRVYKSIDDPTLTKADCQTIIDQVFAEIADVLVHTGADVVISNFGTFKTTPMAARHARDFDGNPTTIRAHKRVAFKTSKSLKERL